MNTKQVKVNVNLATERAAKIAVAKGNASSVKGFYEQAIQSNAMAFYEECANLEGITLDEWIESMKKGEF